MTISRKKITDYVSTIANVAQTSHYQVNFSGLKPNLLDYLKKQGVDGDFISREAGLRCSSASLPGSSLATASIEGNYQGVREKMAHSRIYTQLDLEFYVDRDYKMVRLKDTPPINVQLIESKAKQGRIGEIGTPVIGPAVANAVFAATGKRLRRLPINKEDLA